MSEQADKRNETEAERLDRNLSELLQELRVALPGVQLLFAFLLVVPFAEGWTRVTNFERDVYYVTLLAAAAAGVCLMCAPARHRLRFRDMDKEWVVESSHKYTIAGLVFLGTGIVSAILFISHVVFSGATAAVAASLIAVATVWVWFGAALARMLQDRRG